MRETGLVLAEVKRLLVGIDHSGRARLDAGSRVRLVEQVAEVSRLVDSLKVVLVGEADRAKAAEAARGTPLKSVLTADARTTSAEAGYLVRSSRDILARTATRDAMLSGDVSPRQARSITEVLSSLPATLATEQRDRAEQILLEKARTVSASGLEQLGRRVLEEVAPEVDAAEDEQRRLEVRTRIARANRFLRLTPDGRGAVRLEGSLASVDAAGLISVIDGYADAARRALHDAKDRLDPRAEATTPEQRRADALVAMAAELCRRGAVESGGTKEQDGHDGRRGGGRCAHGVGADADGDARLNARPAAPRGSGPARPRVVVVMNEESLRARAEQAGILESGELIPAGDLRRMCCDADLVPVVLGGEGQPLDVGRARRLVTPAIRQALSVRDGGCAFPGCHMPDARCEAHHITPWWAGGATALGNLVLLCPHHHGQVEPARFWGRGDRDPWTVRINEGGLPEFTPPWRQDRSQTAIVHERHRLRVKALLSEAVEPALLE